MKQTFRHISYRPATEVSLQAKGQNIGFDWKQYGSRIS
jgi:hypothetical protein